MNPAALKRNTRMYLSRALTTSLAPPDWVSVNLTLRCNLHCSMCTTCYDVPDELSTAEVFDLIDQVALMGVRIFNPLGGEPFVRMDLEDILAYAARKDFYITLTTNGTLITKKRADRLARIPSEQLHLNISFDGPQPIHDQIRGRGMYGQAMRGYHNVRAADAAAGNPRRKVLANTIVHDKNLEDLPALLDEQASVGFDGVQLLNLFRHGWNAPHDPDGLWIHDHRYPALQDLMHELVARVEAQGASGYRILNSRQDLELVLPYYRDELKPLEAPCWAGWKELYINADGTAIMCDGELEFLKGSFGNVRQQTLRQIWNSPELRARRQVVKQCSTPCIQNCYLRRDSDSARQILKGAATLVVDELRDRVRRKRRSSEGVHLDRGVLTLELSDTGPWPEAAAAPARRHHEALVGDSPVPFERCYDDPFEFYELRNRRYVRFDRGFLGFEVVRKVVEDLQAARLSFHAVRLDWRGEPLMHPEFVPVLRWVLEQMSATGVFRELQVLTDARLLNTEICDVASFHGDVRQTWILHGNGFGAFEEQCLRNVDYLLHVRKPAQRVVASWLVDEPLDPHGFVETWQERLRQPVLSVGRLPEAGDAIWFRRTDHEHFAENAAARERLVELADVLGVEADPGADVQPRCPGPFSTPVVSWDGKLTLCTRDRGLQNRVGSVTDDRLSRLWLEDPRIGEARREARGKGLPGLPGCRDCHFPCSSNYRLAGRDEGEGL